MRFRLGVEHVFLVVGLAMLAGAWVAYDLTVRRPRTWPQTDALVVSSRVVNPRGPDSYSPEIVFRYDAAGEQRDVAIVPSWSTSVYGTVRAHVDEYPAGATLRVAVNPDDPLDIRYDLSSSLMNLLLPGVLGLMGLIFGGVGVGVIAANRRSAARPLTAEEFQPALVRAAASRTARRMAWAFFAIGLLITGIGVLMFQADLAKLRQWPDVEATVVDSRRVSRSSSARGGGTRAVYDVEVTFRYAVGDRSYQSTTLYGIASSSESRASNMLATYAPGTAHVIRYRPGDPNVIRFDMDSYFAVFVMSIALLAMGLVFVGFAAAMFRSFRRDDARTAAAALAGDGDDDLAAEDRFRPRV